MVDFGTLLPLHQASVAHRHKPVFPLSAIRPFLTSLADVYEVLRWCNVCGMSCVIVVLRKFFFQRMHRLPPVCLDECMPSAS